MAFGWNTTASGNYSTAMGSYTTASGNFSTAMGDLSTASGNGSTAMGRGARALSFSETAIGSFNTLYAPASTTTFLLVDRQFTVGIGTSNGNKADGFMVMKSGLVIAPELTNALIDSDPQALVTKQYLEDNSGTANGWALDGNVAGSDDFIGTTNDEALRFKQNNQPAGFINIFNTAFGQATLPEETTGIGLTAMGQSALNLNTSGNGNTAFGSGALFHTGSGSGNTATGANALSTNTVGENNTAMGANADVSTFDLNNATAIGAHALVSQNNSLVLGSINGLNDATADTKVGIGTTTPDALLDIKGGQWDLNATEGDLRIGDDTYRLKVGVATGGAGAGNVRLRAVGGTNKLWLGAGDNDVLSVGENGHVGINNENPDEELVIGDNLGSGWVIPAATIGNSSGGAIQVGNPTTHLSIDSGSGGFDRARIIASDANGYDKGNIEMRTRQLSVGISPGVDATNPYPLRIIQGSNYGLYLQNNDDANKNWELYASNTGNLTLYSNNGSFAGSFDETSGNYTAISDERLKTNIVAMPSISQKLLQLDAKNYNYKSNLGKKYNGFLAQDIQKIFPEVVTEIEGRNSGDTSVLTVDYAQLTVLSIKAIQEQQEIIEAQDEELNEMRTLLERLEARMDQLEK